MNIRPFGLSEEKPEKNFIWASLWASITIWICNAWWPEVIPFETFGAPFWGNSASVWEAVTSVWFIFAWGMGINFIIQFNENRNAATGISRFLTRKTEPDAGSILAAGTIRSFLAGTLEELSFRWILFLGAIASLTLTNWMWGTLLGLIFIGSLLIGLCVLAFKVADMLGLFAIAASFLIMVVCVIHGPFGDVVMWFYTLFLCPLADLVTLGYLHDILSRPHSWAVGAAVLSTNAFFRDGHKYQGTFGVINAWFGGMIFFWILFEYGLVACMFVHFLYDFTIYATAAFMRLFC